MSSVCQRPAKRNYGFTLLELMVVIAIISILVTLTSLSVGSNDNARLKEEAQRLTALIDLAMQEAVLKTLEISLTVEENGYAFRVLGEPDENGNVEWVPVEEEGALRPREMPDDISLSLVVEGDDPENLPNDPLEEPEPAQVWILSSGELSPFEITLARDDGPSYRLQGDYLGTLVLEGPIEQ